MGEAHLRLRLLLLICVVSAQCGIDDVIHKHYLKLKEKYPSSHETRREPQSSIKSFEDHHCVHDELQLQLRTKLNRSEVLELQQGGNGAVNGVNAKRQGAVGPMRTSVDTTFLQPDVDPQACFTTGQVVTSSLENNQNYVCKEADILTPQLSDILENVIAALQEIIKDVLSVPSSVGPFTLDPEAWIALDTECFPNYPIPQNPYISPGVPNTDFVIFVTARPSNGLSIAFARACNFELIGQDKFGRPLAGGINFEPSYFRNLVNVLSEFQYNGAIKIAVHELTHALGFSALFYPSYVDVNGFFHNSPTIIETSSGSSPAGQSFAELVTKIATPRVIQYAQDHFLCDSLDGVELENFGGSGTAGSHWEMRVVGNEFMAGFINPYMPISGLTLALFEDMGWYTVNQSMGEYWGHGKEQGCEFIHQRCEESWPGRPGYWCTELQSGCTADRVSKGSCNVVTNKNLPAYYQHFENPSAGGVSGPADYCPFFTPLGGGGGYCIDSQGLVNSNLAEKKGPSSACWDVIFAGTQNGQACYEYNCVHDNSMQVMVNGNVFNCPPEGGDIELGNVLDLSGNITLNCPPASLFCRRIGFPNLPGTSSSGTEDGTSQSIPKSNTIFPTESTMESQETTSDSSSSDAKETEEGLFGNTLVLSMFLLVVFLLVAIIAIAAVLCVMVLKYHFKSRYIFAPSPESGIIPVEMEEKTDARTLNQEGVPWYNGSREEAQNMLKGCMQSSYVVRGSKKKGCYAITTFDKSTGSITNLLVEYVDPHGYRLADDKEPQYFLKMKDLLENNDYIKLFKPVASEQHRYLYLSNFYEEE